MAPCPSQTRQTRAPWSTIQTLRHACLTIFAIVVRSSDHFAAISANPCGSNSHATPSVARASSAQAK
jgi:hypothetical protein